MRPLLRLLRTSEKNLFSQENTRRHAAIRKSRAFFNEHGLVVLQEHEVLDELTDPEPWLPVIDPKGQFYHRWQALMVIVLIILSALTAYTISFYYDELMDLRSDHWLEIAHLTIDLFLLVDCGIHFNLGIIVGEKLVMDRWFIAKHYIKSGYFFIDFLSSVPLVSILRLWGSTSATSERWGRVPRLLKLLKVFRMIKVLRLLKLVRATQTVNAKTEHDNFPAGLFYRLGQLLTMLFLLTHTCACVFVLIAQIHYNDGQNWATAYYLDHGSVGLGGTSSSSSRHSFVENLRDIRKKNGFPFSRKRLYSISMYWASTTLTTVGYGDVTPVNSMEMWWCVICQFVGTLTIGYIMSHITSTVIHADRTAELIREKMLLINAYMKYRDMPDQLRARIRSHYALSWQQDSVWDESEILAELPDMLRAEVLAWNDARKLKDLSPVPAWISRLNDDAACALSQALKPERHNPQEPVVLEGKHGSMFYVIKSGQCEVVITSTLIAKRLRVRPQMHLTSLTKGEAFCEYALFLCREARHPYSVLTNSGCELFALAKRDFQILVSQFPIALSTFLDLANDTDKKVLESLRDARSLSLRKLPKYNRSQHKHSQRWPFTTTRVHQQQETTPPPTTTQKTSSSSSPQKKDFTELHVKFGEITQWSSRLLFPTSSTKQLGTSKTTSSNSSPPPSPVYHMPEIHAYPISSPKYYRSIYEDDHRISPRVIILLILAARRAIISLQKRERSLCVFATDGETASMQSSFESVIPADIATQPHRLRRASPVLFKASNYLEASSPPAGVTTTTRRRRQSYAY